MSTTTIVVKADVLSDEDTILQTKLNTVTVPYKRVIETVDNLDSSASVSHAVYIFSMRDAESVKEILMKCTLENASFKAANISIEVRHNKSMPFYAFCMY